MTADMVKTRMLERITSVHHTRFRIFRKYCASVLVSPLICYVKMAMHAGPKPLDYTIHHNHEVIKIVSLIETFKNSNFPVAFELYHCT